MAGEALAFFERCMLNRAAPSHGLLIMAVETEALRSVLQGEWILARSGQVAGIALGAGHRAVQASP